MTCHCMHTIFLYYLSWAIGIVSINVHSETFGNASHITSHISKCEQTETFAHEFCTSLTIVEITNGKNEQTRIDQAVKTINREIRRKLEEFGYVDTWGNVLSVYRIPTVESVKQILGR